MVILITVVTVYVSVRQARARDLAVLPVTYMFCPFGNIRTFLSPQLSTVVTITYRVLILTYAKNLERCLPPAPEIKPELSRMRVGDRYHAITSIGVR